MKISKIATTSVLTLADDIAQRHQKVYFLVPITKIKGLTSKSLIRRGSQSPLKRDQIRKRQLNYARI